MSRIHDINIHDSNADPIINNSGRMPVYQDEKEVNLYDAAGAPWVQGANGGQPVNAGINDPTAPTRFAELDSRGAYLVFVLSPHSHIHAGLTFRIAKYIATQATVTLAFKVESQPKVPHFTFNWAAESSAVFTIYRGATWDVSTGTDIVPINSDHNSSNTSILQSDTSGSFVSNAIILDPVNPILGTDIVFEEPVWGTNQSLPSRDGRNEMLLLPGQSYIMQVVGGVDGKWFYLDWYEEADS